MSEQSNLARLIVFTPLPPRQNGIADYSYELLTGLAAEYDCIAVVEDGTSNTLAPPGVVVISETQYRLRRNDFASSLHIYQLGNNQDHGYILPYLQMCPGLVVLHDLTLHHLLDCVSVSAGDMDRYIGALEAEHGVAGLVLGEQFRRFKLREDRLFFDMPMTAGIASTSRGVIVHSKYGAAKVRARCPSVPVTVVPHQYSPPPTDEIEAPDDVRYELGVAGTELLFMSLGFVTKAKRIDLAIRALAAIRDRLPPFKYVVAGELRPQEVDILSLAKALGMRDRLITPGYVNERRFFSLLRAADVVINLRHPVGGETSGTMIRALGAGSCVVVVDRGPFAEIPAGAAVPIRWGPGFEQRLADALLQLGNDPDMRRRIGDAARSRTEAGNSLRATVAGYKRAIALAHATNAQECGTRQTWAFPPPHQLNRLVAEARQRHADCDLPVWFSGGMLPVCGASPPRTLVLGAGGHEHALLGVLGYAERMESREFPGAASWLCEDEKRAFDLVVCFADPAEIAGREGCMLAQLNQRLAFGGMLAWSVARRSAAGEPSLLEQRHAGQRLLQSYGFRVDATSAWSEPLMDDPADPGAIGLIEQRCWRAYKTSEVFAHSQFWTEVLAGIAPAAPLLQQA
jgi:glycosyltransferase involved in cell wall biosynthesis